MKKVLLCLVLIVILIGTTFFKNSIKRKDIIYESLVYIEGSDRKTITSGSGFVYKTSNGKNYILTNYHVIEGYYNIYVYNSKKEKQKAEIIKFDKENDIAVLSIEDKLNLKAATIGDSNKIKKNSKVFVIGNPKNSNKFGVITTGKIIDSEDEIKSLYSFIPLTISAKTDLGNSGGPLLNSNNEVIGMIFLKSSINDSISLAIPINYIMVFVNSETIENGINLGAAMTNTDNIDLLKNYGINTYGIDGVVIINLDSNGILKKQGIKTGDIITKINDSEITNILELQNQLSQLKKSDSITLTYYRYGKPYSISFEI